MEEQKKWKQERKQQRDRGGSDKLVILVDMDGTIADFEGEILRRFRERYPNKPFIELNDRRKHYVDMQYLKEGLDARAMKELMWEPGFYENLPPIEGAIAALQEMTQHPSIGKVFLCTSPLNEYEHCVLEKYHWVEKHLGPSWVRQIIVVKDKTLVRGNFLIDDKPSIHGVFEPEWEHVVFDQPYNRQKENRKRLTWANWKSVLNLPS